MVMAFLRKPSPPVPPEIPSPFPLHYPSSQTTSCSNMDAQPGAAAARMALEPGGPAEQMHTLPG